MEYRDPNLSRGLDYYKLTMGDLAHETHPDAEVTFTLKNRNHTRPLSQYVTPDALQDRFNAVRERGFSAEEVAYYAGLNAQDGEARFTESYLTHLADLTLPDVTVAIDHATQDLAIQTTGPWTDVSLWETIVMSEVNEEYYQNLIASEGLSLENIWAEGDRRLSEKIATLQDRPDIKFADFGTRRRFSAAWHEHVIDRLSTELPANFVGTSNPWFAHKYNLPPVGTFAHEMPMVYSGLADLEADEPLKGHTQMLQDWERHHRGDLSIALTDTYGSEFFFSDFTPAQAAAWRGLRHDSGDPIEFGERAIEFYLQHDINPQEKTIVFSDGLNVDEIIRLADHFGARVNVLFGWGTSLMNDLGLPANNFVMKATAVDGQPTVKLSDDPGKHTGPLETVERYQTAVAVQLGKTALAHA